MDALGNLDKIVQLILKRGPLTISESIEIACDKTEAVQISKNNVNNDESTWNEIGKILTSTELLLKIFLNNYESRFNFFIEYIFQQIENLFHSAASGNALSDVFRGHLFKVMELLLEIAVAHPCDTYIKRLTNFYKCNINEIKLIREREDKSDSRMIEELTLRLSIISVIYETVYNSKEIKLQCVDQLVKCMISLENDENEVFAKIVCHQSEVVMMQTLIDIIPKFIEITKNYKLLELLWEEICNLTGEINYIENSRSYIIFCYLSNFYFVSGNKDLMKNIFTDKIYWILLQNGLINPDCACRKQALFLMKTSLNYIIENEINFYCAKKEVDSLSKGKDSDKNLAFIQWDIGMKFDEFQELCIIVEYLEEKQFHIVKPVFSKIEKFHYYVEKQMLDVSWMLIIIDRMLNHDNVKVVREGVSHLLKINATCYSNEGTMRKAVKLLVTSLNFTQIYMTDLLTLLEELKTYFENCSLQDSGEQFFTILIEEMCKVQWSSEALFSISYSFESVKLKKFWKLEQVNLVKELVTNGTANHYTYIKSGIQCNLLLAAINLIDTRIVSIEHIHDLLNCYQRKVTLKRETLLWESVAKWIKNFYSPQDAERFIISSLGKRNVGRMMVLLCDSYADDELFLNVIKELLENISSKFVAINARPYCDKQLEDSYLAVICDVIEESSGKSNFSNIFSPILPDIVSYIKLKIDCINHMRDFESFNIFINYLRTILNYRGREHSQLSNVLVKWFDEIVSHLISDNGFERTLPIKEFIRIRLVNVITDYISWESGEIELWLRRKGKLNGALARRREDETLTTDLHSLWGKMNSEYFRGKWKILAKMEKSPAKVLNLANSEFISTCLEALELAGSAVLFPLISALGKELPSLLEESSLEKLLDVIWRMMMERKKNEDFQSLIKQFVESVFQLEFLTSRNEQVERMAREYSRRMLSEEGPTTANALVKHVQQVGYHDEAIRFFHHFLPRALLFGQAPRKEERLIRELCSIIDKCRLSPLDHDFTSSNEVRARSLRIVFTLDPRNEDHSRFADNLVEALKLLEESYNGNKTRYFSDSHVHRVKQRLFQALLVLDAYSTKEGTEKLWNWLSDKVLFENNQPSVRYMQEWLMLRIVRRNAGVRNALWSYFDESSEKRTGSLCSLMSVIYHSLKCIPIDEIESWIGRAVETFLPYCMAQHFSVRLYGQVTLEKLLETAEELGFKSIAEKFALIKKSLRRSIETGNAIKNSAKMQQDFYFAAFDPVEHYSLETIFFEIPRLTNVNQDEFISRNQFEKVGFLPAGEYVIPLTNANRSLANFSCGKWIMDGSKQENVAEYSDQQQESGTWNFQKKMIPLKCLIPEREELLQNVSRSAKKIEKDGLVVVASLVDRIPNLGGLSRTCEVFGASELVIGSLKYTEDKQFQSLSVTAEKWIAITEVKSFHLLDYLIRMKRNGYTILAAEQTLNSQSLESVKFPKKSLLLLGNEKEGVPPTLLPLTDICVQVPQIGVIRSLNVHVAGALFVWEYAKQHHF